MLLCARDPEVPFTDIHGERDLRMSEVKQKVSGSFPQGEFAEVYCRISSYLQTMAKQRVNPLFANQFGLDPLWYTPESLYSRCLPWSSQR